MACPQHYDHPKHVVDLVGTTEARDGAPGGTYNLTTFTSVNATLYSNICTYVGLSMCCTGDLAGAARTVANDLTGFGIFP